MSTTSTGSEIAEQGRNIIALLAKQKVVRLDLGGGKNPVEGYLNVDICDFDGVDIVADLRRLDEVFPAKSVDAIMCRDVIPCFKATEIKGVMRRWARVLKPRSRFVLQVLDARQLFEAYAEDRVVAPWTVDKIPLPGKKKENDNGDKPTIDWDKWKTYLYGPGRDEWTSFHNCYDEPYLRHIVESVGFEIQQVDYPPLRIRFTMRRKEHKA